LINLANNNNRDEANDPEHHQIDTGDILMTNTNANLKGFIQLKFIAHVKNQKPVIDMEIYNEANVYI
jgi:hypothetical protein